MGEVCRPRLTAAHVLPLGVGISTIDNLQRFECNAYKFLCHGEDGTVQCGRTTLPGFFRGRRYRGHRGWYIKLGHWVLAQYLRELASRLDFSRALRARELGEVFVSDAWHITSGANRGHY